MSMLEELEEALYGREGSRSAGRGRRETATPSSSHSILRTSWEEVRPRRGMPSRMPFSKMTAIAALAGILFIVGAGAFMFLYLGSERREVKIEIGGRDAVEGGETVAVSVTLRNISAGALEDTDLIVVFPQDTLLQNESGRWEPAATHIVRRIGALPPGEERTVEFAAQFFGREGDEKKITASLAYRPAGIRARFSAYAEKQIRIARVPLAISWDIPDAVSSGQEVPVTVRYSSQARTPFDNLYLRMDYPPGLAVVEVAPAASSTGAVWPIGALAPGDEGKIFLRVVFGNVEGDLQTLRAGIGTIHDLTKEWKPWLESVREVRLSGSPFLLEGATDGKREGVIKPGDFMSLTVRYKNRASVAVKNISIHTVVEGDIADLATLTIGDGGVFDVSTRSIVWGPGGTDALREVLPGQEGVLHFSLRARPRPVIATSADKNLTLRLRSRIETASIPAELLGSELSPEDRVTFKIATIALISGRSVFRTAPIANSGPLPPRVGEKTTYVIVWEVRNFTNEIEGAEMRVLLPPNVRWEDRVSPGDADVRFDAAGGEVRWRLGRVSPATGVLTPSRIAAFQVSLVPSEIDLGRSPALTGGAVFSGRDGFTNEEIKLEMPGLTTQLPEDPLVKGSEWMVVR